MTRNLTNPSFSIRIVTAIVSKVSDPYNPIAAQANGPQHSIFLHLLAGKTQYRLPHHHIFLTKILRIVLICCLILLK